MPDLRLGETWPDLDTFRALARDRRVIPVLRRFLADVAGLRGSATKPCFPALCTAERQPG
jgi:hypothetical protein